MNALLAGFGLSLGLIAAIGAQNAFVLRQGLSGRHVLPVVIVCAGSDALLIAAGVAGAGVLVEAAPGLVHALTWGGIAFLALYGLRSFHAAWRGGAALGPADGAGSLRAAVGTCIALTWLNPHVYLDTVVLIGSVSTGWPEARLAFWTGAAAASATFFLALGFGARALAPVFARPGAWRALEAAVGATMWTIAGRLAISA